MYQAQDTFVAQLDDGSTRFVRKGDSTFRNNDELVLRDLAAQKDDPDRTPLFVQLVEDDQPAGEQAAAEAKQADNSAPPAAKHRPAVPASSRRKATPQEGGNGK